MKSKNIFGIFLERSKYPYKNIREILEVVNNSKLFVFKVDKENKYLLTFESDDSDDVIIILRARYKNVIRLHRKSNSNTLFTINAINLLKSNKFDWDKYKNSCLLVDRDGNINTFKLQLKKIVKLGEKKNDKNENSI